MAGPVSRSLRTRLVLSRTDYGKSTAQFPSSWTMNWPTDITTASLVCISAPVLILPCTDCAIDSILWPLFHYHPGEITFDESAWEAYKEANRLFAKEIAKDVQDNDLIWVHDYHLMLLPAMLREEIGDSKRNVKFGFFLHTPFPSSEIYRILPVRNEILNGVLHCDLIGFHTYDYARHFLSSCSRIL
jgi:hypothetical protein